jgi:hypothetical protein
MSHPAARRPIAVRFASAWPVWSPLLLLLVYTAPFIHFLLPANQDYLGEIYQPLQALKFFATRGTTYHKYGPAPNFILAPVYGPTLGYWYLTGSLSKPSDDFPYGFSEPLPQLGFLILEHRLVFLTLGLCAFAFLGHRLGLVTDRRVAVALAMIFCIATNYPIIIALPTGRPDSPMLAFLAAALGVYLAIVYKGLTPTRAFWLSTFAVLSISSKELTTFVFVPSYLGLAWTGWRAARNSPGGIGLFWRSVVVGVLTGVLGYALLNIVYAPSVWLQRMEFWWKGPGVSPEVWGNPTRLEQAQKLVLSLMTNLGPGGTIVAVVASAAAVTGRVRHLVLLSLPSLGALLGAIQVRYGDERFLTPLAACLTLVVAAGLGQLLSWRPRPAVRALTMAALIILAVTNLLFAGWSWVILFSTPEYTLERYAQAHIPTDRKLAELTAMTNYETAKGSTRLERFGYSYEHRPSRIWAEDPSGMPDVLFTTKGYMQFYDDIKKFPARGELLKQESGFEFSKFRTPEGLGYELAAEIVPASPPWWFPTSWIPWEGNRWIERSTVLVYIRPREGADSAPSR